LSHICKICRYFDVNATKEILAEFLPKINPWSSNNQILYQLAAFLPVSLPPEHADKGHLLWFDELMTLWDTIQNASCGISVSVHRLINVPNSFELVLSQWLVVREPGENLVNYFFSRDNWWYASDNSIMKPYDRQLRHGRGDEEL